MDRLTQFFPFLREEQVQRIEQFCRRLEEKNQQVNLVSRQRGTARQIFEDHVLPSLAAGFADPVGEGEDCLDVGTGGGFPGVPLAILFPRASFFLLDSIGKKIRALEEILTPLLLKNVELGNDRVENLKKRSFDRIYGRAVCNLPQFVALVENRLRPCGKILYLSGGNQLPQLTLLPGWRIDEQDLARPFAGQFASGKRLFILQRR